MFAATAAWSARPSAPTMPAMRRLSSALLLACLLPAASARADEAPPPSFFACEGKKVGDACDGDDGPGRCAAETCSKLDYSQGTPPGTLHYDCLQCRKGAPAPSETPPATMTAGAAPTAAPAAKSGCRIDDTGGAAGLLALLALAGLRRRRG